MGSSPEDEDVEAPKQPIQPHLMPQDAKTVDPSKLTALSPEVVCTWTEGRTTTRVYAPFTFFY